MKKYLDKYSQLHKDLLRDLLRLKEVQAELHQTRSSLMFCYDDEEDSILKELSSLHKEETALWASLENAVRECEQIDLAASHDIVTERGT